MHFYHASGRVAVSSVCSGFYERFTCSITPVVQPHTHLIKRGCSSFTLTPVILFIFLRLLGCRDWAAYKDLFHSLEIMSPSPHMTGSDNTCLTGRWEEWLIHASMCNSSLQSDLRRRSFSCKIYLKRINRDLPLFNFRFLFFNVGLSKFKWTIPNSASCLLLHWYQDF